MTSATARVIKPAHCAAILIPASNTNSTTIGMTATTVESTRLPAIGSYTCWYMRLYPLDCPIRPFSYPGAAFIAFPHTSEQYGILPNAAQAPKRRVTQLRLCSLCFSHG